MMQAFPRHGTRFLVLCVADAEEDDGLASCEERVGPVIGLLSGVGEASGDAGANDGLCASTATST